MLNIDQIGESIRIWIENATSLNCIYADGSGPRLTDPYLTIKIAESTPLGEGDVEATALPDYSLDLNHSKIYDMMVSINAFRGSASQEISKLVSSLDKISTLDYFNAAEIGIGRASAIREISEVINKKWEDRAQIDLFFHVRSLSTENIEGIKQIQITNELDDITTIIKHPDIP